MLAPSVEKIVSSTVFRSGSLALGFAAPSDASPSKRCNNSCVSWSFVTESETNEKSHYLKPFSNITKVAQDFF